MHGMNCKLLICLPPFAIYRCVHVFVGFSLYMCVLCVCECVFVCVCVCVKDREMMAFRLVMKRLERERH